MGIKKEFEYVGLDASLITIRLDNINCSILWNNKGRYGLIPFAKIQNALEIWKDKHENIDVRPRETFSWAGVIPVPPQIANALLGEDKDDKCTYNSKGGTDRS